VQQRRQYEPLMKALHAQINEWLDSYKSEHGKHATLNRQIFRCLSWYDITSGNTLESMNPENINSVELIVLKKIFDLLTEDGWENGF